MINGLMMLVSFFMCRVMLFPILYWWYSSVMDTSLVITIISMPVWVHIAALGLWFPQLIWFSKMIKGSMKIFKDRQKYLKQGTRSSSDKCIFTNIENNEIDITELLPDVCMKSENNISKEISQSIKMDESIDTKTKQD